MKVYFSAQPWDGGRNLEDFLAEATDTPSADSRLRIAVAWTKRSGIDLAAPHIERVRESGGRVELITGLSAGGATRQGLARALELCDTVHVVYDESGPTFHPKLYMYRGDPIDRLLLGSNNLTAGGYFRNVEAALAVEAGGDEDREVFDDVDAWLDELIADEALTLPLTAELLDDLVGQARFRIGDEDAKTSSAGSGGGTAEVEQAPTSPFSKSLRKRRYVAGAPKTAKPAPAEEPASVLADEDVVVNNVWSKSLSRSEALRPNPGSNPTAVLRLGKAGYPIDKNTYFVEEFFGALDWSDPDTNQKSVCVVPFDCTVDGVSLGIHKLKVDHKLARVARQNNVPTVLHWGSLSPFVRDVDHIGSRVILRVLSDDTYQLEIKDEADVDPSELP